MPVKPEKWNKLLAWMKELEIDEKAIEEKFILGSGRGGQKMNKTASCVYLKHLPTGIEIKCQSHRERDINRYAARELLCEEIEYRLKGALSRKGKEIEKAQKQKKKRAGRSAKKYES